MTMQQLKLVACTQLASNLQKMHGCVYELYYQLLDISGYTSLLEAFSHSLPGFDYAEVA